MPDETIESFEERRAPPTREQEALLQRKIAELDLKLEGTRLEQLIERLYGELQAAGIKLRPPVYLSDEWGCPDGMPIIGVPFYLADEKLTRLEDEMREGVEAESDEEILRYLRHEAGHAFNYAYELYKTDSWHKLFGPYSRPYVDEYTLKPFSHNFVRHLSGWYAQKHPDEDFAETFAVWLTPDSNWREAYKNWGCYPKLVYVDEAVQTFGQANPVVTAAGYNTVEECLYRSLADHYGSLRDPLIEIPPYLDSALRDIFNMPASSKSAKETIQAAAFIDTHRRVILGSVAHWTGLNDAAIRAVLRHLRERCKHLNLRVPLNEKTTLVEFVVLVTTLCMNKLHKGEFVGSR